MFQQLQEENFVMTVQRNLILMTFKKGTDEYENRYVAWYERNWIFISIGLVSFMGVLLVI